MWWHTRRNQISSFVRNGPSPFKRDGACAETRFRLSRETDRGYLNRRGGRRQFSRLLAAEVCGIIGSNVGYTVFRGSVKSTTCILHSPVSPSLPPPVRHRVTSHFNWSLLLNFLNSKYNAWLQLVATILKNFFTRAFRKITRTVIASICQYMTLSRGQL
jgi:hypothetical protein